MRLLPIPAVSNLLKCSAAMAVLLAASAHAALVTLPQSVLRSSPGVYTPGGYYTTALGLNIVTTGGGNAANIGSPTGRNDDGFMSLGLGFDFTLYGTTYNSLFINNNGNVSFGSGISSFVPTGPTGANAPLISVFFSDVDTRATSSGVVHYNLSADNLVVTWDNVGRYNARSVPPSNSFQLVLRSDDFVIPNGEGQIGFFYEEMDWEVTDTSTTGAVGFGDGMGNATVIDGSNAAGMNNVLEDRYLWFNANLTPTCGTAGAQPCPTRVPEPGSLAVVSLTGAALLLLRRRKR